MSGIQDDLGLALAGKERLWEEIRSKHVFMTGGTGFVGCWLLESFLWANRELSLHARVTVLTRDSARFRKKAPHLAADPSVRLLEDDVERFTLPADDVSHVVHAAGEPGNLSPQEAKNALGRVLMQARSSGARKILLMSSGAVYRATRPGGSAIAEDESSHLASPGTLDAYGESKLQAEALGAAFADQGGLQFKIARGFAFMGAYMPLNGHFAAGNFIADILSGGSIHIRGNGAAIRSYLHAADMAAWLWTILFRGTSGRAYNVGSDSPVSILELAKTFARTCIPAREVQLVPAGSQGLAPDFYVPDISRARTELGLSVSISLDQAVGRTLSWYRNQADR